MNKEKQNVSIGQIERMIARIKKDNPLVSNWDKYNVSFEFICGSLFPSIWKNIQERLKVEYENGFADGKEIGRYIK